MGLVDEIMGKKKKKDVGPHEKFVITQRGEDVLQKNLVTPKSNILLVLQTRGSSTVDEIANSPACRQPRGKVERLLPRLEREGLVRRASASSSDGELDEY